MVIIRQQNSSPTVLMALQNYFAAMGKQRDHLCYSIIDFYDVINNITCTRSRFEYRKSPEQATLLFPNRYTEDSV